ncbi:hypothetical protein ABT168_02560 [Streptomyces sp. NPDC001793]|uniref:hypothetical protein n=1 Tax=Streptomyces sp. NPDC001793 TaxID=3154657 RepID=UPI00331EB94D
MLNILSPSEPLGTALPAKLTREKPVRLQTAELLEQKIKLPEVAQRQRVSRKSADGWQ